MSKTIIDRLLQPGHAAQAETAPRRGMTNRAKGWLIAIAFSLTAWAVIVIIALAIWPD